MAVSIVFFGKKGLGTLRVKKKLYNCKALALALVGFAKLQVVYLDSVCFVIQLVFKIETYIFLSFHLYIENCTPSMLNLIQI